MALPFANYIIFHFGATYIDRCTGDPLFFLDIRRGPHCRSTKTGFFINYIRMVSEEKYGVSYTNVISISYVELVYKSSDWYTMSCGIHQGGFLSLVKYIAFINSLLVSLKESNACCAIYNVKSSPVGYADDVAAASTSKNKMDRVLSIADEHSKKWRYDFNASKSAILVHGETEPVNKRNIQYRNYWLGDEGVKEKKEYDHVGLKSCNCKNYIARTEDKIGKGRRSLNAATSLGIRKGGLTIYSCNIIYWCMIVPIVTYGCELWILKENDIESLDKFQRYAGRRIQRFPPHSPNEACFRGLGWMRLENFIYGKKLIFIRTILIMDDTCIYKSVLKIRAIQFNENIRSGMINEGDSPMFDRLRISIIFGLYEVVMNMIINSHRYSKEGWKKLVFGRAWEVEDNDWDITCSFHKSLTDLNLILGGAKYLVW